jgi:hypothetical protein
VVKMTDLKTWIWQRVHGVDPQTALQVRLSPSPLVKPRSPCPSVTRSVYQCLLYTVGHLSALWLDYAYSSRNKVTSPSTDLISIRHPVPTPTSAATAIGPIRQKPQGRSIWLHPMHHPVPLLRRMRSNVDSLGAHEILKHTNSYSSIACLIPSLLPSISHTDAERKGVERAFKTIRRWYNIA